MIANQQAIAQILRLSGLPQYPREQTREAQAALDELVAAMRQCDDAQHAQAVTTRLLRTRHWCPTPADVYEAIDAERKEPSATLPGGCQSCRGTGWRTVYLLATWDGRKANAERITEEQYHELKPKVRGIGVQQVYTAVEECACPLGRTIRGVAA